MTYIVTFRGLPACPCLATWLPVYEAELTFDVTNEKGEQVVAPGAAGHETRLPSEMPPLTSKYPPASTYVSSASASVTEMELVAA